MTGPRRTLLPALLALTVTLAGCATGDEEIGVATETVVPPAPTLEEPPDVVPRGPVPDGEPELRQLHPDAVDVAPRPWEEAFVLEQGRTVELRYWSGQPPCAVPARVEVEAGEDTVVLTLFEGREPTDEPVACPEVGVYTAVRVELDEPVGRRSLVDGARS